jgi:ribosomal RNA-processing protein 8
MLFDTPLLNVQSEPVADSTSSAAQAKKRKRSNSSTSNGKDELAQKGAVNLEKLMKTMKKIDGASSGSNMTPIGVRGEGGAAANQGKGKGKAKGKNDTKGKGKGKGTAQADEREEERESGQGKSKKQKQQPQKKTDSTPPKPSQSSSLLRPTSPVPSGTPSKPFLHSAPNASSTGQFTAAPQTAMQAQLRAKLAGGKFRMLNETLYTTSGQDAWNLMKEEGAFDDVSLKIFHKRSHSLIFEILRLTCECFASTILDSDLKHQIGLLTLYQSYPTLSSLLSQQIHS